MTRLLLLAAGLLFLIPEAFAQRRCWRPDPPSCVEMMRVNRESFQFNMCRSEVVRFQQEVQEYLDCQRRDRENLLQELDAVIARFNACARSEFC